MRVAAGPTPRHGVTSTTPWWISTSRWGPIRRIRSAYNNRGNAWYRRGDFDRAIADDEAIRLEPNYGHAYINRGGAGVTRATSTGP